jgi:sec-independent protein translocase protein TatA
MFHFSAVHIILVFVVVLLLFGPKRLPELARGLGEGMKEFKHAMHDVTAGAEPPASVAAAAIPPQTASRPADPAEKA